MNCSDEMKEVPGLTSQQNQKKQRDTSRSARHERDQGVFEKRGGVAELTANMDVDDRIK